LTLATADNHATNDDTLPAAVAKVLGISVEEVLEKFEGFEQDLTD